MLLAQSDAWPPFYRQLHDRTPVQSMIYGPTDLQGAQPETTHDLLSPTLATPQCASPPTPGSSRPFSGLQSATRKEATDLGILLQAANGEPAPFLGGRIVLWRAGQYQTCLSLSGTTRLVYGSELVVAFLLPPDEVLLPQTVAQLESDIVSKKVRAVGIMLKGATASTALRKKLAKLNSDILKSGRCHDFSALRIEWKKICTKSLHETFLGMLVTPVSDVGGKAESLERR